MDDYFDDDGEGGGGGAACAGFGFVGLFGHEARSCSTVCLELTRE